MRYLRNNTATRVTVGPFLDKTDGVTPETGLTVTNDHLTLVVDDGGTPTLVLDTSPTGSGGNNDMVHITGDDAGLYDLELTAANLNYLGRAMLALTDAANHCPVFHEFTILPQQVYDSLVLGSDLLDANASQLGGTAQTGRDVGASVLLAANQDVRNVSGTVSDKTGYALSAAGVSAVQSGLSTLTAQQVWEYASRTLSSFGTLVADVWAAATRSLTDKAGFALAAGHGLAQEANVQGHAADALAAYDPPTRAELTSDINGVITQVDANEAKLDTALGNQTTINNNVLTRLASAGYTAPDNAGVAAIKAKTDNLPASPAAVGSAMDLVNAPNATAITALQNGLATAAALAAVDSAVDGITTNTTGIPDSVLDEPVEGTTTLRQMLRLMAATLLGKATGGGTVEISFRDLADTKARVVMTVDENGNRSAVTLDAA